MQAHEVNIHYNDGTIETLYFTSKENAIKFCVRQNRLTQVKHAKYEG